MLAIQNAVAAGRPSGFLKMTGGTIATARLALEGGVAMHLGGGLHHAFPGHGEGFCPINDIAVAIRALQQEGRLRRAAVVDCDVHQGNGTAVCFAGDKDVFTFSIHQEHNYPPWKPPSDLDIGVRDRTTDGEYLEQLQEGIEAALIIGIVLMYLGKTGRARLRRYVYAGVGVAALASIGLTRNETRRFLPFP